MVDLQELQGSKAYEGFFLKENHLQFARRPMMLWGFYSLADGEAAQSLWDNGWN